MRIGYAVPRATIMLTLLAGAGLMTAEPAAAMIPEDRCTNLLLTASYWDNKYYDALESGQIFLEPIYFEFAQQAENDAARNHC